MACNRNNHRGGFALLAAAQTGLMERTKRSMRLPGETGAET
jgi:hypothetical protein